MSLQERIHKHSQFFQGIVDLIPPQYLKPVEHEDEADTTPEVKKKKVPNIHEKDASLTLSELRERLHAKIEEAKHRRGAQPDLYEGLRPTSTAGDTDGELKSKKGKGKGKAKGDGDKKRPREKSTKEAAGAGKKKPRGEPGEEDLDFSKIRITKDKTKGPLFQGAKKPSKKALLKNAEKQKKKMEKLAQTEAGQEALKSATWDRLGQLAAGVKLKDDPTLIRKSLKRDAAKKKKSAKEWAERLKKQNKDNKERIASRESNIEGRKKKKGEAPAEGKEDGSRRRRAGPPKKGGKKEGKTPAPGPKKAPPKKKE